MPKLRKPNFFIIGAPKCGTTALSEYLKNHPSIVMSEPKEPHYFATDMPKMRYTDNEKLYLEYFKGVSDRTKIIGDASVWYLYSTEAIVNIHKYNPEAKIIVMLRSPIEMVPSMHAQHIYSTDEDISLFEDAWNLNGDREKGENIPKHCRSPKNIFYNEIAKYTEQIERVYKYFPKTQVKIILFDDFKKDAGKVYRESLQFLELEDDGKTDFPIINENTALKNYRLKSFIVNQPEIVIRIKNFIKKVFNVKHLGVVGYVNKLNTNKVKRVPLSEKSKDQLIIEYKDDIKKLSKLIKKDLDGWLD